MQDLESKLKKIKLAITDVDGVLTDGGLYYTSEGLVMKKFNVKDGMGTRRLHENNFKCGIISTDGSELIEVRNKRLKMDFLVTGSWNKLEKLEEICDAENIGLENVAYLGDDINDLEIINGVGFSSAPSDAVDSVLNSVDYICKRKGGDGVFREFAELIISGNS
ncbi:MAG: HAD hydrolase family protein [Melioribacteraceae bacterium]|jgi:3-deoxy-D-manno-octulosonate 8-phosphate phosphatase (KDO 8-P phosphatase)|nr:HAD hydrolase family protein [Melioribacteraceae bacterium]